MFELLTIIVFTWILFKTIGLTVKLTWGAAKVVASILMVLALPLLIVCLLFVSGIALVLPVIMVCIAAGITKFCVKV